MDCGYHRDQSVFLFSLGLWKRAENRLVDVVNCPFLLSCSFFMKQFDHLWRTTTKSSHNTVCFRKGTSDQRAAKTDVILSQQGPTFSTVSWAAFPLCPIAKKSWQAASTSPHKHWVFHEVWELVPWLICSCVYSNKSLYWYIFGTGVQEELFYYKHTALVGCLEFFLQRKIKTKLCM